MERVSMALRGWSRVVVGLAGSCMAATAAPLARARAGARSRGLHRDRGSGGRQEDRAGSEALFLCSSTSHDGRVPDRPAPVDVEDLLRSPALQLTLVAGAACSGRPVAWAHVSELAAPTPWLTGRALVMSTGMAVPRFAAKLR